MTEIDPMVHWRSRPQITDRSLARFRMVWFGSTALLIVAAAVVLAVGAL